MSTICKQIQKLTGASEVPTNQLLSSFGIDSMVGTELIVSRAILFYVFIRLFCFALCLFILLHKQIWLKDKFNLQITTVQLMTVETVETITQRIVNNNSTNSTSTFSSSTTLALQDSIVGIETDFVKSKKIYSQFQVPMQKLSASSLQVHNPVPVPNEPLFGTFFFFFAFD